MDFKDLWVEKGLRLINTGRLLYTIVCHDSVIRVFMVYYNICDRIIESCAGILVLRRHHMRLGDKSYDHHIV